MGMDKFTNRFQQKCRQTVSNPFSGLHIHRFVFFSIFFLILWFLFLALVILVCRFEKNFSCRGSGWNERTNETEKLEKIARTEMSLHLIKYFGCTIINVEWATLFPVFYFLEKWKWIILFSKVSINYDDSLNSHFSQIRLINRCTLHIFEGVQFSVILCNAQNPEVMPQTFKWN